MSRLRLFIARNQTVKSFVLAVVFGIVIMPTDLSSAALSRIAGSTWRVARDVRIAREYEIPQLAEWAKGKFRVSQPVADIIGHSVLKVPEKFLRHIFGVEEVSVVNEQGLITTRYVTGFHHDQGRELELGKKVHLMCKHLYHTGEMRADVLCNDTSKVNNSFFSPSLTRMEVLQRIAEAVQATQDKPMLDRERWVLRGKTTEGMVIQTIVDKSGDLVSSYPITCYMTDKHAAKSDVNCASANA